jgi:hypothetical protein
MNSQLRERFCEIIQAEIEKIPGVLAKVYLQFNNESQFLGDIISVHYVDADGHEFSKDIPLTYETIMNTDWHEIGKSVAQHIEYHRKEVLTHG